jgi:flagellar biosynthesis/type III secretory pathway protein FliH
VDQYQAEDDAVDARRDEPDFDEAKFREGLRAGYDQGHSAGYAEGFSEGLQAGLDAVNRESG